MGTLTYTTLGGITAGAPNTASDVTTAFTQAQTSINNIESANIVDGTITATDMAASSGYTAWRNAVVIAAGLGSSGSVASGTYWFTGASAVPSGSAASAGGPVFFPTAADYAVTGKTTTFRLACAMACNATTLGTTATFGVYPVTASLGGAQQVGYTLGTLVAGSTCAFTSTANALVRTDSSTFTLSATTPYVVGCVLTGATSANHTSTTTCQLQMSYL